MAEQGATARRRPGRPKAGVESVGSDELVAKTIEFLRARPIAELTWASLADGAGVSGKLFAYYFEDRTELLTVVLEKLMADVAERIGAVSAAGRGTPTERLKARLRQLIRFYSEFPFFLGLVEHLDKSGAEHAMTVMRERNARAIERFTDLIADGQRTEGWGKVDEAFLFATLIAACGYYASEPASLRLARGGRTDADDERYAELLTQLVVGGLGRS